MRISDWSSDVCSSDLEAQPASSTASATTDALALKDDFIGRILLPENRRSLFQTPTLSRRSCDPRALLRKPHRAAVRPGSEQRRVGKECGSTCSYGGSPCPYTKKSQNNKK